MKYNININQIKILELAPNIDIKEATILDYLITICQSKNKKIQEKRIDGFTWINYTKLIEDLPLLKITSKGHIGGKLKNLENYGFIEIKQINQNIYINTTEKTDLLFLETVPENEQYRSPKGTDNRSPKGTNTYTNLNTYTNNIFNEFLENDNNKNTGLYLLLKTFFELGYKPSKSETIEGLRDWTKKVIELNKITSLEEFKNICLNFELYWKGNGKEIKNLKTTFLNNPNLLSNKKKNEK